MDNFDEQWEKIVEKCGCHVMRSDMPWLWTEHPRPKKEAIKLCRELNHEARAAGERERYILGIIRKGYYCERLSWAKGRALRKYRRECEID